MDMCSAGLPDEFASPEIVVTYRLHAGGLQRFCGSCVCGTVRASNTRTNPYGVHTMTFRTRKCQNGSRKRAYRTLADTVGCPSRFRGARAGII